MPNDTLEWTKAKWASGSFYEYCKPVPSDSVHCEACFFLCAVLFNDKESRPEWRCCSSVRKNAGLGYPELAKEDCTFRTRYRKGGPSICVIGQEWCLYSDEAARHFATGMPEKTIATKWEDQDAE